MADLKKLTILHSNDMHGDFLAEEIDDDLVGGVSMLSGYLNKVRTEDPEALYVIAGDMFRGSIIDAEYQGVSTIEIMNYLAPDVVTLGNHEVDYGMAHLLFLEKCCKFPIVNANLYIKTTGMRIFNSHKVLRAAGMNILFIGIITEEIMAAAKNDNLMGTFVDINEAAEEVGKICDNYKSVDIDLTILLTHVGFEEDKKLAKLLMPEWGVDLIIGGHSHTLPEKPEEVNNILIVQAGTGTNQIGRFDIVVDADTNSVAEYKWQAVPISEKTCPRDEDLEQIIHHYKDETDRKYNKIVTHFPRALTHPKRNRETELGNLFADIFVKSLGIDLMLVGSGSIRKPALGPVVRLGDLKVIFPFEDEIMGIVWTGAQLRRAMQFVLRDEMFSDETEFYQVSKALKLTYDAQTKQFTEFTMYGKPVADDAKFRIGLQIFHYSNMEDFFGVSLEETSANEEPRVLASSDYAIVEEYLLLHNHLMSRVEGRLEVLNGPNGYPNDIKGE